eukprot:m.807 g.807  ORF g.807 m.807 type:complete len:50 (-) comp744_c0_seq1:166-315(-)
MPLCLVDIESSVKNATAFSANRKIADVPCVAHTCKQLFVSSRELVFIIT